MPSDAPNARRRSGSARSRLLLRLCRMFGLFALARRLTGNELRILCYHGTALDDEDGFSAVFMRPETFRRRMRLLKSMPVHVLPLDEAVRRQADGTLPAMATVITIDDGWLGTYRHMFPVLEEEGLPATLYVATSWVGSGLQVYNVAVGYVLWRRRDRVLATGALRGAVPSRDYDLSIPTERAAAERELKRYGFGFADFNERQQLWRELCDVLGEDWSAIERDRKIAFMDEQELGQMIAAGIDIQLHTHGHRFPADDRADALQEVEENRRFLDRLAPGDYRHFCYPSGQYDAAQIPWLEALGIATATTTRKGLNGPATPRHELRRILDADAVSDFAFEAEVSGLFELVRRLLHRLRRLAGR